MNVRNERIARFHAALVPGAGAVSVLLGLVYLSAGPSYSIRPVLYLVPGGMFGPSSVKAFGSNSTTQLCSLPFSLLRK